MPKIVSPGKIHGGKSYLASWIISLMPPRCQNPNKPDPKDKGWLHYVEPYFGMGAVLLAQDPAGISEVAGDADGILMAFWRVLEDANRFEEFYERVQAIPFSERRYQQATEFVKFVRQQVNTGFIMGDGAAMDCAVAFFIASRQSLAGRRDTFAPRSRSRTRRGMNEQVSAWITAIDGLPEVHERMQRVCILNGHATTVIAHEDGPRTLFYLDPPYLHETRATTGEYGEFEMTPEAHLELLSVLSDIEGRFLLSGYRSKLYDDYARQQKWNRHERAIHNHAASGKTKRVMTEIVLCNY